MFDTTEWMCGFDSPTSAIYTHSVCQPFVKWSRAGYRSSKMLWSVGPSLRTMRRTAKTAEAGCFPTNEKCSFWIACLGVRMICLPKKSWGFSSVNRTGASKNGRVSVATVKDAHTPQDLLWISETRVLPKKIPQHISSEHIINNAGFRVGLNIRKKGAHLLGVRRVVFLRIRRMPASRRLLLDLPQRPGQCGWIQSPSETLQCRRAERPCKQTEPNLTHVLVFWNFYQPTS